MKINNINLAFNGKPNNYKQIDKFLSRSAQPAKEDFAWLKSQGVTDIINFRTEFGYSIQNLKEKQIVEDLGMNYHYIASITVRPRQKNIEKFLDIMKEVFQNNRKAHMHCKAGADRTGMYAYIYESINNISTQENRIEEWISMGHNVQKFPNLIQWTIDYVNSHLGVK